ncbi:MAG: DedA family protein, partial [Phycicoccus sp.]
LLTAAGSGVWNAVFIALGYRLGDDYRVVDRWAAPVSAGVLVVLALGMVWLAVRRRREQRRATRDSLRRERQGAA